MNDRVETRVASDGYRLACRHSTPDGAPRGWFILLHGIQSHSGWYDFTRGHLVEQGYDVRIPDRRGSGLNEIERGHAQNGERLVEDVVHFLDDARSERDRIAQDAPLVLGGLSWGGKLAYAVAKRRPELPDGLVLLYPAVVPRIRPSWEERLRLWLARRLSINHRVVPLPLDDPALFTSVDKWQDFIRQDGLALHEVTSGLLFAGQDLEAACRKDCGHWPPSLPVLLMLAGRDRIIDNEKVRRLLRHQVRTGLTEVEYPDAQHTLEFEPCRDQYISDLIDWLSARVRRT